MKYLTPGPFIPSSIKEFLGLKLLQVYGSKRGLVCGFQPYHTMCLFCTLLIQKLNYVMDVLVPEAIVKLIRDKTGLDQEQVNQCNETPKLLNNTSSKAEKLCFLYTAMGRYCVLEINSPVPQYPEARAYYVCEIKKGIEYVVSH